MQEYCKDPKCITIYDHWHESCGANVDQSVLEGLEKFREGERRPMRVLWFIVRLLAGLTFLFWAIGLLFFGPVKKWMFSMHCMRFEEQILTTDSRNIPLAEDCWKHPENYSVHPKKYSPNPFPDPDGFKRVCACWNKTKEKWVECPVPVELNSCNVTILKPI